MEASFDYRKQELMEECPVAPQVFDRVMPWLERFMEPFVATLVRREQVDHAHTFVQGFLSDLENTNVESIAYALSDPARTPTTTGAQRSGPPAPMEAA